MYSVDNDNAAILIGQNIGPEVELAGILFGPPVVQVSIFIELTTHIVETVGHFMTDNHPDGPVIHGIVGIGIEKRRLQDTGRETYLVGRGVVIGIYRLRTHIPQRLVDRLTNLVEHICRFKTGGTFQILPIALFGRYFKSRIIAPFVGITDFYRESCQLFQRPFLGIVAHPFELFDMLTQGILKIGYQFQHSLFRLLREIFGHIYFAQSLTQYSVGCRQGAFPAGTGLLLSRKGFPVEIKSGCIEIIAQVRCRIVEQIKGQIIFYLRQRELRIETVEAIEERQLGYIEVAQAVYAQF